MKSPYTFQLSDQFLNQDEQAVFNQFVEYKNLEKNIWMVFSCMFDSKTNRTQPFLLKAYREEELIGVAVLIKCKSYGRALFSNSFLAKSVDLFQIPCYLWIKFGCCMDMMSNIGFVKEPQKEQEVLGEMITYLKRKVLLTIITDYTTNSSQYTEATELPSLPHALIDTSSMINIEDYINGHKNIKRKIRKLTKLGGTIEIKSCPLELKEIERIKSCFLSTTQNSVFYLPYQDLYLQSALKVSNTQLNGVYYFIVKMNNEIIGYQAAIKSGKNLNALHGAFDRKRSSNHHAYDVLFVKMTEFALENNLSLIDYGLVLNVTKQRMVNKTLAMSYFIMSKFLIVQWIFNAFLKLTRIQGQDQLKYRNTGK